jgi:Uma2 family endonuclease
MAIVTNFSDLDLSKTYTYADYLLFQFQERIEIIKGRIFKMSPAPSSTHQRISQNINFGFYTFFKNQPCSIFTAPFDVLLPISSKKKETTIVQPDLCIICDETKINEKGCMGSPDLIVEILSPNSSKHDITTKFNLYEEAGVLEYWIIEPSEKIVLVYSLQNGKYIGLKPFSEEENVKSILFPNLEMPVATVFNKIK